MGQGVEDTPSPSPAPDSTSVIPSAICLSPCRRDLPPMSSNRRATSQQETRPRELGVTQAAPSVGRGLPAPQTVVAVRGAVTILPAARGHDPERARARPGSHSPADEQVLEPCLRVQPLHSAFSTDLAILRLWNFLPSSLNDLGISSFHSPPCYEVCCNEPLMASCKLVFIDLTISSHPVQPPGPAVQGQARAPPSVGTRPARRSPGSAPAAGAEARRGCRPGDCWPQREAGTTSCPLQPPVQPASALR